MKILFFTCLFYTVFFTGFSQNEVKLTFHDLEIENTYDPVLVAYTTSSTGDYVFLKKEPVRGPGGWRYYIEVRDHDMKKTDVKEVSSKLDADNYIIDRIILMQGKLVVFSSKLFADQKKEVYYQQSIDMTSLDVSKRKKFFGTFLRKKKTSCII